MFFYFVRIFMDIDMSAVSPNFKIIQSNQIETLFEHLSIMYQDRKSCRSVFEPFHVIVPSMVMGEWLKKQVADTFGISTLVTTEFWGRYYWSLVQRVARSYNDFYKSRGVVKDDFNVPDVAMLSKNIMQWRIFGYLLQNQTQILQDEKHVLYPFIEPIVNDKQNLTMDSPQNSQQTNSFIKDGIMVDDASIQSQDQRLWQFSADMASMFNRYMTYRENWLEKWGKNQAVNVQALIDEKDKLQALIKHQEIDMVKTPDWLVEHYMQLEQAQRFLWRALFDNIYQERKNLQDKFWQVFDDKDKQIADICRQQLPTNVVLFTVQQLPPSELNDLKRLSELVPVTLLHFNPSEQFWADIVDKNWLLNQQLIDPTTVYLKDYGHTLLSRFGKQSREVFAMLADLSGNEYEKVEWIDEFEPNSQNSLLSQLQNDILMLDEGETQTKILNMINFDKTKRHQQAEQESQRQNQNWQIGTTDKPFDSSLAIHACHSMTRQLEVLRTLIISWLNNTDRPAPNEENNRRLSDILVLLPNIEAERNVIEAVFPKGVGADGYHLPAKITGVVAKDVNQFWQAVMGYYTLLNKAGSRFHRMEVFDWLMLPQLYESFGLNLTQMQRTCELLSDAGFVRGFDELHLSQTLHDIDDDYRYTFAYALERLVAGLFMPNAKAVKFGERVNYHGQTETIEPLPTVKISDKPMIAMLCQIYQTLNDNRHIGKQAYKVDKWLSEIENLMKLRFEKFNQTNAWKAIFSAQNELKRQVKANSQAQDLPLKLNFMLQSINDEIASQQVSAEPSSVITFARIGAVRNLPYKLVVMLNLNLADFPQQEQSNRYNLMQAGVNKRGDRFREDDDLGAFLDALLCAKEACWLFYNAKNNTDIYQYLPASPVQELLDFLSQHLSKDQIGNFGEKIQQYLVTHHASLPFDKQYFEINQNTKNPTFVEQLDSQKANLYPPSKVWYGMYEKLHGEQKTQHDDNKIRLWLKKDLNQWLKKWQASKQLLNNNSQTPKKYISLSKIFQQLQNPAKSFLNAQNLSVERFDKDLSILENLKLDGLSKYQLNADLLQSMLNDEMLDEKTALAFNDILPAGVNRYQALDEQKQQIQQHLHQFIDKLSVFDARLVNESLQKNHLPSQDFTALSNMIDKNIKPNLQNQDVLTLLRGLINPTHEQHLAILINDLKDDGTIDNKASDVVLKVHLPTDLNDKYWLDYLPNSGREKYQIRFWLSHLCWQVTRKTSDEQQQAQHGFSLWQYSNKQTLYLPAIQWQQAYAMLQDWLMLWQLTERQVIVLPPQNALQYLQNIANDSDNQKSKMSHVKEWVATSYNFEPTEENFEFNQWQLLIGDKKANVILRFLDTLGEWAYQPLRQHLVKID